MNSFIIRRATLVACITLTTLVSLSSAIMALDRSDGDGSDGAKAVKVFLTKTHPKQGWDRGPTPVESDAIRKAYPSTKFYYVFSDAHRVGRHDGMLALVGIGKDAKPVVVRTTAEFSAGLAVIKSEDDAKTAAAALFSLTTTSFSSGFSSGFHGFAVKEITAKKTADGGWSCTAVRETYDFHYNFLADFSADGKCIRNGFGGIEVPHPHEF